MAQEYKKQIFSLEQEIVATTKNGRKFNGKIVDHVYENNTHKYMIDPQPAKQAKWWNEEQLQDKVEAEELAQEEEEYAQLEKKMATIGVTSEQLTKAKKENDAYHVQQEKERLERETKGIPFSEVRDTVVFAQNTPTEEEVKQAGDAAMAKLLNISVKTVEEKPIMQNNTQTLPASIEAIDLDKLTTAELVQIVTQRDAQLKALKEAAKNAKIAEKAKKAEEKAAKKPENLRFESISEDKLEWNEFHRKFIFYVPIGTLKTLDTLPLPQAKRATRALDENNVTGLYWAYQDETKSERIPPIDIQFVNGTPYIWNGRHRHAAQVRILTTGCTNEETGKVNEEELKKVLSMQKIAVVPSNFTSVTDLLKAAFAANAENGLGMSSDSKSAWAAFLMECSEDDVKNGLRKKVMSAYEAEQICGVSHNAIYRWIERHSKKDEPMLDKLLQPEELAEARLVLEKAETKEDEDALLSASKSFFNAAKRVVALVDKVPELQMYFTKHDLLNEESIKAFNVLRLAIPNDATLIKK